MPTAVLNNPSEKSDNLTNFHGKEPHPSTPTRKDIPKGQLLIGGRWRDSSSGEGWDNASRAPARAAAIMVSPSRSRARSAFPP